MLGSSRQTGAPLFDELSRYIQRPLIPFHTPGHKAGLGLGEGWFRPELLTGFDLTEISSLAWEETLEAAESLAAEFYQADRSFFLTQGATQGILAMLLGAFNPGETVLVARNCHCSVINGLILAGLRPVFLNADILPGWGIPLGVSPHSLEKGLNEHPDTKGFVMTNPTYQGIAAHLQVYREILGERLMIVDEAHGGYFQWMGFPGFDAWSVADLWVQGTHKILGSLTQTGLLHIRNRRVDVQRIQMALKVVSTTSPSYVLLASLDYNRNWLAQKGQKLFQDQRFRVRELKEGFAKLSGLEIIEASSENPLQGTKLTFDPWKLCLSFRNFGLTGFQAEALFRNEGIQPEYADADQVTFFIAPWQQQEDLTTLLEATNSICHGNGRMTGQLPPILWPSLPEQVLLPREAALGEKEEIPISQAEGRIAAATLSPYPPGAPLVAPGERIRQADLETLATISQYGGKVNGIRSGKIFVVK